MQQPNCAEGGVNHGSYDEFQGVIDAALRKSDANSSIPWGSRAPSWAGALRPGRVTDLGFATGEFTSAVLSRLREWGCLAQLHNLLLVEEEPDAQGSGAYDPAILKRKLLGRDDDPHQEVSLDVRNASVAVTEPSEGALSALTIGGLPMPPSQLVVAAHFTYYFPEAGAAFLRALAADLHGSQGVGWIVVRMRGCPIYQERCRLLAQLDPSARPERGYAEDLQELIEAGEVGLRLVDMRDQHFPMEDLDIQTRLNLVHLLMWRNSLDQNDPLHRAAAERALALAEPPFSERHLIVTPL